MSAQEHLQPSQFDDYTGIHRPPSASYGAPAHDVENVLPDFYSHPEYYDHEPETRHQLQAAKGNPDATLRIYRAMPAEARDQINTGDWVTTSASYARGHAMHPHDPSKDMPVTRSTAKASELHTAGEPDEWGYLGPSHTGQRLEPEREAGS